MLCPALKVFIVVRVLKYGGKRRRERLNFCAVGLLPRRIPIHKTQQRRAIFLEHQQWLKDAAHGARRILSGTDLSYRTKKISPIAIVNSPINSQALFFLTYEAITCSIKIRQGIITIISNSILNFLFSPSLNRQSIPEKIQVMNDRMNITKKGVKVIFVEWNRIIVSTISHWLSKHYKYTYYPVGCNSCFLCRFNNYSSFMLLN